LEEKKEKRGGWVPSDCKGDVPYTCFQVPSPCYAFLPFDRHQHAPLRVVRPCGSATGTPRTGHVTATDRFTHPHPSDRGPTPTPFRPRGSAPTLLTAFRAHSENEQRGASVRTAERRTLLLEAPLLLPMLLPMLPWPSRDCNSTREAVHVRRCVCSACSCGAVRSGSRRSCAVRCMSSNARDRTSSLLHEEGGG
jgi:hypothetical protein